jgi:carbohydrate-binding DOMON domain-containing protein
VVPDLGTTTFLIEVSDPAGDDYGPGTYTYPSDGVFTDGSYDAQTFQVGFDDENIVFRFLMGGPVENVWGSPNGLSIQTFDVYIDQDGDGQGGVALLPGRNLSLSDGAWDYAVHVEGWTSGIYVPGDEGPQQVAESSEFQVLADPGQRRVTIRIPKAILGDDPENWRYAALVLSQEGFPSGGVMRVRDVMPVAEQWRIGGAPAGATNHTRVLDLIWANPGDQESWLLDFEPSSKLQAQLTAEDFAAVPLFGVE